MKRYKHHIALFILGIIIPLIACANTISTDRLTKIQHLIDNNLLYDKGINADSIQLWEKQLSVKLEKEKNFALLFEIKLLSVKTAALADNTSIALNNARIMYNKAKEMNYQPGIGLALCAIGDTYSSSNNLLKAIDSYREAIALLEKVSENDDWIKGALCQYILIQLNAGQTEKVFNDIYSLEHYCKGDTNASAKFYIPLCYAYFYIQTNQLQEASMYLQQAQVAYKQHPFKYYLQLLRNLYAIYYLAVDEYPKALKECDSLLQQIGYGTYQYVQTLQEQAHILALMGDTKKACQIYQVAYAQKDSLDALRYSTQINTLHSLYQVDQKEIKHQEMRKSFILKSIAIASFALLVLVFFVFRIRRQNKHLLIARKEQEKAKTEAEKSIRTKSLLLSNMSHEIRTPLNALSGFSSILTEDAIDEATRKQCNEIIERNSELLLKLINDVIDLSDLEIGKMEFNFAECNAVNICQSVIDMIAKIKQTSAETIFVTQLDSLKIITDSSRLQQLLINLLINATKFTPKGTITLELKQEGTMGVFSITDTGCGIPKEKQGQIFSRFEKLNEHAQGTGLGLSICQLIIEQLGGKIWIDPEYTGGSRFWFTHPIEVTKEEEKA